MIQPHGGKLVDRIVKEGREVALQRAGQLFQLSIDEESDIND